MTSKRLWTLSDLHDEEGAREYSPPVDFDILVVAGDVVESDIRACVERTARLAQGRPAVMVLGNHDLYGLPVDRAADVATRIGTTLGVTVLERSQAVVDGVAFAGGTLWDDVMGRVEDASAPKGFLASLTTPRASAPHPFAPYGEPVQIEIPGEPMRPVTFVDIAAIHEATLQAISDAQPDVVVTHYPPSRRDLEYAADAALWIHGHVHAHARRVEGPLEISLNAAPSPDFVQGLVLTVHPRDRSPAP